MHALHGELLDLEHDGWRSLCDATAGDFYGQMMTDTAHMILAGGMIMTRSEVVEALVHAPPWDGYTIEDSTVIPVNADAATLVYTGTGRRNEGPDFVGIMASTYVRTATGWRLVLYQQTPKG